MSKLKATLLLWFWNVATNPPVTRIQCSILADRTGCGRAGLGPERLQGRRSAPPPPPVGRLPSSCSAVSWFVDLRHMTDCKHPSLLVSNCAERAEEI